MDNINVIIKYYNRKMLLTMDLYELIRTLFSQYGDGIRICIEPMNEDEQYKSSSLVNGITAVHERFWVLERVGEHTFERKHSLEDESIARGQK